ncbi:MAG: hypothetical protein KatS3mg110_4642 [Pirellulaceae bacterium]|nr:MAG: hypothetical protein KatS3mg110_0005 [Pirellulaceae bacterium]GIW96598.1 MAG: hypothetical protein KatS3mg110_4639 [Pirellulaceae bacterium]GIW96601.1 MAG: hypothetical protein KatS3mg110_4642 [Pirellulaceae bacterium]
MLRVFQVAAGRSSGALSVAACLLWCVFGMVGTIPVWGQDRLKILDDLVLDEWVWQRVSPEGRELARQYMEAYKKIVDLYCNMEMTGTAYQYRLNDSLPMSEWLKRPYRPDSVTLSLVSREHYYARRQGASAYLRWDSEVLQSAQKSVQKSSEGRISHFLLTPVGFWRAVREPEQEPTLKEANRSAREGEARMTGRFFAWAPISTGSVFVHETIFTSKERMQATPVLARVDEISKTSAPNGDRVTIKVSVYMVKDPSNRVGELSIVVDPAMGWVVLETDFHRFRPGERSRRRMEVEYDGTVNGIGLVRRQRVWEANIDLEQLALFYDFQREDVKAQPAAEREFTLAALGFNTTPPPAVQRWWQLAVLVVGLILIGLFVWGRLRSRR